MIDSDRYLHHLRRVIERNGMDVDEIVLPTETELTVRGLRLHYHDWGNPTAPPVLLLHGAGLTAHTWDAVCLGLRSRYHCLAIDFRGHGDSEWAEEYEIEQHVEDVRAVVESLRLEGINLVGMSMGGMVAVRYAGGLPGLRSLSIIDIGPEVVRSGDAQQIQTFIDGAEMDSIEDFVERSLKFNPKRDREMLRTSLVHNLRELPNGRWTWKYDRRHCTGPRDAEKMIQSFRQTWERVSEITCPVLVVRGAESRVLSEDVGRRLAASLVDGRYVEIPRAGHTVQGDNPADLTKALLGFLGGVG